MLDINLLHPVPGTDVVSFLYALSLLEVEQLKTSGFLAVAFT
jgi:hypothetical protein